MDGTVPKIFYNFYLNFMNFLIFFKFQGAGLKISNFLRGARPLVRGAGPLTPPPRQPITLYWHIVSITELVNPRDAPTPENSNLQHWFF